MRCADCGLYECILRSPMGGCPNGEAVEQTVIITAPDSKPYNLGNGPWDKGYEPAAVPEERNVKIAKAWQDLFDFADAASDLVDAVERYMRQECLRSELAMKKEKLKALIHD